MTWWIAGSALLVVLIGAIRDRRSRRIHEAKFFRHPWRSAVGSALPSGLIPVISLWHYSVEGAVVVAVVFMLVAFVFHGLAWGADGPMRRRYIRRYGAPHDSAEHRWLPEHSSWPY